MKLNKTFLFLSCFLCINLLWSQTFSISGSVVDTNNEPIAFANILLLKAQDSLAVTGTSSDENGNFIINNIQPDSYFLKTSFIGFKDNFVPANVIEDINNVSVVLEESIEALNEVRIFVERPTLKREPDRLVFKVENTALSQGNLVEVLRSTPSVLVLDDAIIVKNSTPTIYVNDRRVHLSSSELIELLQGTSASNIKSVEVITNPPAKYDADSGVVLNIVMSKNLITGYNGSVFSNYTQGVFPKSSIGTSHYFKSSKLNLFFNYSYNIRKDNRENQERVLYPDQEWNTHFDRNTWTKTHNLGLNLDYELSDKSSISLAANAQFLPYHKYITNSESLISGNIDTFDRFISKNVSKDDKHNIALDLDYNYAINEDSKLRINTHYTNYDYARKQNVNSNYFIDNHINVGQTEFNSDSNQDTNIFTSQFDYSLTIDESSSFEAGAKYSNVNTTSGITQYDVIAGEEVLNTDVTNMFDYKENVYAAYLSYDKNFGKFSLGTGLRAEQTKILGVSLNESNPQDYLEFFPTISLGLEMSDKVNTHLTYKRSIDRPEYDYLNPFVYYLNDNTLVTGNPNLKPVFTDNITLGVTLNNKFVFDVYYKKYTNNYFEIPFQDNDNNTITYMPLNLDSTDEIGFDFEAYLNVTDNWFMYFGTSIYNYKDRGEVSGVSLQRDQWSNYSDLTNSFRFLEDKSLTANLTIIYLGKNIQGFQTLDTRWDTYFSIAKTLFKGNGTISLAFSDLFNKQDFFTTTRFLNQNRTYSDDLDTRYVRLGFRYKFGNTKLSTNQRTAEKEELDRLEKKH